MKTKMKFFILCCISLLLTGCMKFNTSISIKKNKAMDLSMTIAIDKNLLGDETLYSDEYKEKFEKMGYTVKPYNENNMDGFILEASIDNIDNISTTDDVNFDFDKLLEENTNQKMFKVKKSFLKNTYTAKFKLNVDESAIGSDLIDENFNDKDIFGDDTNNDNSFDDNSNIFNNNGINSDDNNINDDTNFDDNNFNNEDNTFNSNSLSNEISENKYNIEYVNNELDSLNDFDFSSLASNLDISFNVNLPYPAKSNNATNTENNNKTLKWILSNQNDENNQNIEFEFELYNKNAYIIMVIGGVGVIAIVATVFIVLKNNKNKKGNDGNGGSEAGTVNPLPVQDYNMAQPMVNNQMTNQANGMYGAQNVYNPTPETNPYNTYQQPTPDYSQYSNPNNNYSYSQDPTYQNGYSQSNVNPGVYNQFDNTYQQPSLPTNENFNPQFNQPNITPTVDPNLSYNANLTNPVNNPYQPPESTVNSFNQEIPLQQAENQNGSIPSVMNQPESTVNSFNQDMPLQQAENQNDSIPSVMNQPESTVNSFNQDMPLQQLENQNGSIPSVMNQPLNAFEQPSIPTVENVANLGESFNNQANQQVLNQSIPTDNNLVSEDTNVYQPPIESISNISIDNQETTMPQPESQNNNIPSVTSQLENTFEQPSIPTLESISNLDETVNTQPQEQNTLPENQNIPVQNNELNNSFNETSISVEGNGNQFLSEIEKFKNPNIDNDQNNSF